MNLVNLQKLLGEVHPILGNLTGLPLYVFLIVAALTALFTLGYLVKGGQVGLQLWLAVRRVSRLKQKGKQAKPADVGKVLRRETSRDFPEVKVNESTYRIDLGDIVRFDSGRSDIQQGGARFLRRYVPVLLKAQASDLGRRWIRRIVVEGFTLPVSVARLHLEGAKVTAELVTFT